MAVHQLEGAASAWWDTYTATHATPEAIGWQEFRDAFCAFHVPEGAMDRKAEEFRNLRLGHSTVAEYTAHYTQLSRYAPDEMTSEKKKMY